MKPLTRYYLLGFPVAIFFVVIFYLLKLEFLLQVSFFLGLFWPFALVAPGMREKALQKSYRYSFIGMACRFQEFLKSLPVAEKKCSGPILRGVPPLLFSLLMYIIFLSGNPLFTLIGWVIFEGLYFLQKKIGWNLV